MLSAISTALPIHLILANTGPLSPGAILFLCIIAAVGTVFLLPSHLHPSWRKLGGVILFCVGLAVLAMVVNYSVRRGRHDLHTVYFWIFSAIALFGAIRVVTHRRPVYSALYFVLTVFATAGLFVLLAASFMAGALVIIYAGAILITYVFVIMLAVQPQNPAAPTAAEQMADYDNNSRDPFIASAIGFALMGVLLFVISDSVAELPAPQTVSSFESMRDRGQSGAPNVEGNTQELGIYLFNNQQVSLELAGLLLTIAMVGAIVIARRRVLRLEAGPMAPTETVVFPATPVDDNPHSIPVYGTDNPAQKAYPET
jgi:NADH-quinone oxidoreductase subunit J